MKKIIFFLFLTAFTFAKEYEIVVATLRYQSGIDKIKKEFKNDKVRVYKKGDFFVVTVGIFDEKDVEERLKEIKKLYPSAFKRVVKNEIKLNKNSANSERKKFIIQIAVLSKKEGIKKIKKDLLGIDVKVKNINGFYKIFSIADNIKEAYELLNKIKRFYPSAFIVGKKKQVFKEIEKKRKYIIFVDAFEDKNSSVLLDFPNEESYVKKENGLNYFYIVNISDLKQANEKLESIRKKYPFAKIVSSLDEKIELETLKSKKEATKKKSFNEDNRTKELNKKITENNSSKQVFDKNETVKKNTEFVEEVMPGEFKKVDNNTTIQNSSSKKAIEEVIVKKYNNENNKQESSINSEIIRKIRKNYIDIAKPADEVYK